MAPLLLAAMLLAADAPASSSPMAAQEAAEKMKVPDGFKVTLVAAEPEVVQPISFCIDDRGRLFVAEAFNYGDLKNNFKDRITILDDTDGDGRADKRTLFYEGLNYVTGIEVGFGGVWVMSPPSLYFIADKDGDDKPDGPPEVVFDGFGFKESRHNLATGFTWGPDGWLYGGHGRTSPSDVGASGTPKEQRVHCDGGVYRIHPTRRVFENFADGTTNPWGVDFDDYGQAFVSNCVNPHLFHMIQGAHYEPWRNRPSSKFAYQRIETCADHLHYPGANWQASRQGTPETLAMGGGHAHCGTLIYLGDSFPQTYRGSVFMCNVHGKRINNDVLKRKGSGYTASHGPDFALAADPWFMGVTLQTGPDGSIYVSDWSDTGECHTYKPHRENGRIFKISYRGKETGDGGQGTGAGASAPTQTTPRTPINIASLSDADLVQAQLHANDWHVRHARRVLHERASNAQWPGREKTQESLRNMLKEQAETPRRLRALWALHATTGIGHHGLFELLGDKDEHLRAWAIQLLCEHRTPSDDALAKFAAMAAKDESPVVRLYLASALQRLPLDDRWPIISALVMHEDDAKDQNLPLMYWYALEPLVPHDKAKALALMPQAKIPLIRQFIARRLAEK